MASFPFFRSSLAGSRQKRQSAAKSYLDSAVLLAHCLHLSLSLSPVLLGWRYSNWRHDLAPCYHHSTRTPLLGKNTLKKYTGFPFENVLSRLYVFQCYKHFWSCLALWTATCLHSVSYTTLFFWHPHAENPTALSLALDPTFGNTMETGLMVTFSNLFHFARSFSEPTISQIFSSNTEL